MFICVCVAQVAARLRALSAVTAGLGEQHEATATAVQVACSVAEEALLTAFDDAWRQVSGGGAMGPIWTDGRRVTQYASWHPADDVLEQNKQTILRGSRGKPMR